MEVSLRGNRRAQHELMDAACDVTTGGAAPKAWVRRNGTFYLLKGGDEKEVDAELLASRIARCFDAEQVLYEPLMVDGQKGVMQSADDLKGTVYRAHGACGNLCGQSRHGSAFTGPAG